MQTKPQKKRKPELENGARAAEAAAAESPAVADLESLAAYYERSYRYLHRQAQSMLGSADAAHDVVQEAFAVTAERIRDGVEINHLGGWLRTVIRNQCTHLHRAPAVLPLHEDLDLAGADGPAEIVSVRNRCRDVYRVLAEMSPGQRSAFLLAELQGLNYHEIAASMGRSHNSVRQLLARARRQVRETVGPDLPSLTVPLVHLGASARYSSHGRAQALHGYLTAKIAHLQDQLAALFRHSTELAGQPAAVLAAGAVALGSVGALGVSNRVVSIGGGGAPGPAASAVGAVGEPGGAVLVRDGARRGEAAGGAGLGPPRLGGLPIGSNGFTQFTGNVGGAPAQSGEGNRNEAPQSTLAARPEKPDTSQEGSAASFDGGGGAQGHVTDLGPPWPPTGGLGGSSGTQVSSSGYAHPSVQHVTIPPDGLTAFGEPSDGDTGADTGAAGSSETGSSDPPPQDPPPDPSASAGDGGTPTDDDKGGGSPPSGGHPPCRPVPVAQFRLGQHC